MVETPIRTISLVVRPEYENLMDYILATFLLLEAQMRTGEKAAEVTLGGQYIQMS